GQIGERLARQFEHLSHKPPLWMDQPHRAAAWSDAASRAAEATAAGAPGTAGAEPDISSLPQDDDERFIVGLVLTYYRRHPQRARTRLLDLLGEVLTPTPEPPKPPAPRSTPDDSRDLWARTQAAVKPLKRKR